MPVVIDSITATADPVAAPTAPGDAGHSGTSTQAPAAKLELGEIRLMLARDHERRARLWAD